MGVTHPLVCLLPFFNLTDRVAGHEPFAAFDINRNGQVGFDEIVRVFPLL